MPLTSRDLFLEIDKIEQVITTSKDEKELLKNLLKAQVLSLRLLQSIRTNLVLIMRAKDIPLLVTKRQVVDKKDETTKK